MSRSDELAAVARDLLARRRTAALGTLGDGRPFVSLVPFAIDADSGTLVILVSSLAAHARNLRAEPRVSLLVAQDEGEASSVHEIARLTIEGDATDEAGAGARAAYLDRFPDAAALTELGDFSFVAIRPRSARVVAGFARAGTLDAEAIAAAMLRGD